ncbi:hypothetical protein QVD17_08484 [Tagetes erecta]|uniref:Uncharacterized protein n=1 Tax=Tagetes erecta TaxID=13708 RepID=A0AAD8KY20_TARER|nr:hypothetical protein QVD17_08484 [Tagetes erecta]
MRLRVRVVFHGYPYLLQYSLKRTVERSKKPNKAKILCRRHSNVQNIHVNDGDGDSDGYGDDDGDDDDDDDDDDDYFQVTEKVVN